MPFMIVSYPWPVPSAHVALTGVNRQAPGRKPRKNQPAGEPDQQRRILVSSKRRRTRRPRRAVLGVN